VTQHDQAVVGLGPADQRVAVHGLNRAGSRAADGQTRILVARVQDADVDVGVLGALDLVLEVAPEVAVHERGHRHRSQPVQVAVEEHEEDQQAQDQQHPGDRHPQIGHEIALDATHQ
jgi:hypothetical protein